MFDYSENDQNICQKDLQIGEKRRSEKSIVLVPVVPGNEQDCCTAYHRSSTEALHAGTSTFFFQNFLYFDLIELLAVKRQYFGFIRKVKLSRKFRTKFIINMDEIPTYFLFQSLT